jgi:hypothetical protein
MLTNFDQVKDWILDNGFKRWVLYKNSTKNEKIIDSAAFTVSNMDDKIAMTEKYLRMAGGYAYAAGATTNSKDDLNTVTEIRLESVQAQQVAAVGNPYPALNEDAIAARVRKEVEAEYNKREYERRAADLEKREKEFAEKENSAMGALIRCFAPVGQAMMAKTGLLRNVAGIDTEEQVTAQPIKPAEPEEAQEAQEENPFTDEEADEVYALMVRFKKAEPDYLKLVRKVVEMAESGDSNYKMAKTVLVG